MVVKHYLLSLKRSNENEKTENNHALNGGNVHRLFRTLYKILLKSPNFYVDLKDQEFSMVLLHIKNPWKISNYSFFLTYAGNLLVYEHKKFPEDTVLVHHCTISPEKVYRINTIIRECNFFYETVEEWSYLTDNSRFMVDITMDNGVRRMFIFKGLALKGDSDEKSLLQIFLEKLKHELLLCVQNNIQI